MLISYAQNQEDVVLHRLTRFVQRGTFVDVGAAHPVIHNVTYSLYLAGWRGINIEPMAAEAEMLRSTRPGDVTHQLAVGSTAGTVVIHTGPSENRGSTTARMDLVERYRSQGQTFSPETVEMVRLETLIKSSGIEELHLLKVDVEGMEREVLEGADLSTALPWVVVVESTQPNTTEDTSYEWESMVLDCGYMMTLFDGLNKFYVRKDLETIRAALSTPANVFDQWVSWELVETQRMLRETSEEAESYAQTLIERAEISETNAQKLLERAESSETYAARLETLLYRANGWLPTRARTGLN